MITEGQILDIARDAIYTIVMAAAPVLLVSLVVGLIISIFQTVTSIQEQTLTFVPKFIAILLILVLCGNWIMTNISAFMTELCRNFSVYIR